LDVKSLEGFLTFSDADLAANRAGQLSPAQYRRLRWSGIWRLVMGPPLMVSGAVAAFLVDYPLVPLFALLMAGLGLYLTWRGFAFLVDGTDRTVAYLTASLRRRATATKGGYVYSADIGPVSQSITVGAYNSLPDGVACHLYYAPGCRSLLSAEPASAEEPKPAHPFGPDAAHAWDQLRVSWVLFTVGALGVLVGAHEAATAHPAHAVAVTGLVANYVERHAKSTSRDLYLAGDPDSYSLQIEDSYAPPSPPFSSLIGRSVVLYLNEGTRNVIGLNDGEVLHAAALYLHPENQTIFQAVLGAVNAALSMITFLVGLFLLMIGRRRSRRATGSDTAPPERYTPPTVRPARTGLAPTVLVAAVLATVAALLALTIAASGR
jgi:hypothetical protein